MSLSYKFIDFGPVVIYINVYKGAQTQNNDFN